MDFIRKIRGDTKKPSRDDKNSEDYFFCGITAARDFDNQENMALVIFVLQKK